MLCHVLHNHRVCSIYLLTQQQQHVFSLFGHSLIFVAQWPRLIGWLRADRCSLPPAVLQFFQKNDNTMNDAFMIATGVAALYLVYKVFEQLETLH